MPFESYGTIASSSSAGSAVPLPIMDDREKKDDHELGSPVRDDDERSLSSADSAQAGVKRIEAISTTWTKWSLAFAYIGSVLQLSFSKYATNFGMRLMPGE